MKTLTPEAKLSLFADIRDSHIVTGNLRRALEAIILRIEAVEFDACMLQDWNYDPDLIEGEGLDSLTGILDQLNIVCETRAGVFRINVPLIHAQAELRRRSDAR